MKQQDLDRVAEIVESIKDDAVADQESAYEREWLQGGPDIPAHQVDDQDED